MTSERWAGFTDEDIERIKLNPKSTLSCTEKICEVDGYTPASNNRGPMKIKKMPLKSEYSGQSTRYKEVNSMTDESKTEREFVLPSTEACPMKSSNEDIRSDEMEEDCTCSSYVFEENERSSTVTRNVTDIYHEETDPKCKEMDDGGNLLPLEIFEMRQKRIEAENARRRALISKAINDKKMQTHAEAIKLAKITQELSHIDSSLSADVSILRNYIEKASLEFSEAEKRYLKAEKEFVESKLFLFEKMQRKEMLTEHLCAIIEQNENRKADKLVELMKQLEMEVVLDDCKMNGISPILPNLCAMNDETYHTCQTLKPSSSGSIHSLERRNSSETSQTSDCEVKRTTDKEYPESMNKESPDVVNFNNNSSFQVEKA